MKTFLLIVIIFWSGHMQKVEVVTKSKEECEKTFSAINSGLGLGYGVTHNCIEGHLASWGFVAGDFD